MHAGAISWPPGVTSGPSGPRGRRGPTPPSGRGPSSTWPSSPSCSTPARARPGGLFDEMAARAEAGRLAAATILEVLLQRLGPIWPGRLQLDGVALGDCWRHQALRRADATNGLVPLHKLSQWLAYSLIEPLQT